MERGKRAQRAGVRMKKWILRMDTEKPTPERGRGGEGGWSIFGSSRPTLIAALPSLSWGPMALRSSLQHPNCTVRTASGPIYWNQASAREAAVGLSVQISHVPKQRKVFPLFGMGIKQAG